MKYSMLLIVVVVLMPLASGCAPEMATSTPQPTSVPTVAHSPTSSGPTAGQLANLGDAVFKAHCAVCHGDQGQGVVAPALIGPQENLQKYGDAQTLLAFMNSTMPQNAPGSLQSDEYFQLLAFLLVQNKLVQADAVLDSSKLSDILLK